MGVDFIKKAAPAFHKALDRRAVTKSLSSRDRAAAACCGTTPVHAIWNRHASRFASR